MEDKEEKGYGELWLKPFASTTPKIKVRKLIGSGAAGYVFKFRIDGVTYALKMVSERRKCIYVQSMTALIFAQFKFYYPELYANTFLPRKVRQAYYDLFLVECRANGSLIDQGMNGIYTPFCYGWIEISSEIEMLVARAFDLHPLRWDRPPGAENERVRGILYEYIDGETLNNVKITTQMAEEIRNGLKGLHAASMAHEDPRSSNIIVRGDRPIWLDLSVARTIPHIKMTEQELRGIQEREREDLEIGFVLLSTVRLDSGYLFSEIHEG